MNIKNVILINQFGQGLISGHQLAENLLNSDTQTGKEILTDLTFLILQSKPVDEDISVAIQNSKLKETYTPCVVLKKGVGLQNLTKITQLPESELEKSLFLLLNLFQVAYKKRFEAEKNNPDKWWYWDLSEGERLKQVYLQFGLEDT